MCESAYRLTGFGCTGEVCTTSRGEIGQCTVPKRLAKYKVKGGSARKTILALVRRTHPLIIRNSFSSQESHEQPCIPMRVHGGLVILVHLDRYYVRGYLRNQHKLRRLSSQLFFCFINKIGQGEPKYDTYH